GVFHDPCRVNVDDGRTCAADRIRKRALRLWDLRGSVKREARLACDRGGAVRETEAQDQEQPRRAEPDERPPEEKLQRFLQGRHGALHIIETGSSLPAAPGCASKRADRYV